MSDCTAQFQNFLIDQLPVYSKEILEDLNPMSGTWIGRVKTEVWPNGNSNSMTYDRMHKVFPNPVREWIPKDYQNCDGNPCDVPAEVISTGGYTRNTFYKEVQKHKSRIFCFDAIRDFTHAEQQWAYIKNEILRPSSDIITSYYMRKRAASGAGNKIIANSTMPAFTFSWVVVSDNEIYIDTNANPAQVFKIAPQMLQRRVIPLMHEGYFNTSVIAAPPRTFEFITDPDTIQDLIRAQNDDATTPLVAQWRFTDFSNADKFWKYGWEGQVGNFALASDPHQLRFNYHSQPVPGTYRYQIVLPFTNVAADVGKKIADNDDYHRAQFCFSYTHHRAAFCMFGATAQSIHPSMPFVIPDLAGEWRFSIHDIGCENYEGNKGIYYARFEYAWKNEHPEWEDLWFHRREPPCIPEIPACNPDPGYPSQTYGAEDDLCDGGCFEYTENQGVTANTITLDGFPIVHGTVTGGTLAALVEELNTDPVLSLLGTWVAKDCDDDDADELALENPQQAAVVGITFV